ncbi:C4-dicarboxylate TRAP transporter substrate-binding protein [Aquabacter spiritensis]|uniref:TRAP-type C4-dicarboxylate transport system substrate-binding protein n=1 Tax=Aquabacter spiritensis TaxID=933073 RepID=A0A4V2UXL4_9HYPH|nr:C4-dicarboxylate TRAP transporter substrate-binding protein [Aquabacter spiritensis]TCT03988.1 TRAP-type C4-dicarboxylate transport system substrate-binding protein [Aquabacter spiritensis]
MAHMTKGLRTGLCAAGLLLASTLAGHAATYSLKIGAGHPAGSVWIGAIRDFFMPQVAERVAKATGDKIVWTEAWGGSVCKLGECLEAVESGLLDIGELQTPFDPAKLLAHNFTYFAPFGTPDPRVAAKAVLDVYEATPALKKVLETRYNQVFLGAGVIGNYGLVTSFKWTDVGDLKGHKIAAAGPNLPWLQGTGVVGVQSNLNEAYTSFQTGVYEGWVMFPDAIVSFKLNEVTKQYVDMDFGCIHTPLLSMNKDTWNDLPPAVQKIFIEVGKEWNAYTGRVTWQKQQDALAKMKELGLDVRQADMATKQAWAKALPNIPKQRFEEINKANLPGEVIYTYIKALKAAGHQFPRDWEAER